ncbi:hypothetical protein LJR230_003427 [Trinickia sp. LjRoot230]
MTEELGNVRRGENNRGRDPSADAANKASYDKGGMAWAGKHVNADLKSAPPPLPADMPNTYTYGIHSNLTPVELFFLIAVDETMDQLGVSDAVGVAMILAGSRFVPTRSKFAGAVKGTSVASKLSRSLLPFEVKHRILPTFTSWTSDTTGV